MFGFGKVKERTTSAESIPQTDLDDKPGKLKRHGTLQSLEVFQAWAKDSFLRDSTIDILVSEHEIDCIPAVLALKSEDISQLGLPVGQQRLLEGAVDKLKQEYELVRPPTPLTRISLETPAYKTMLEISEKQEGEGIEMTTPTDDFRSMSSQDGQSSREISQAFASPPYGSESKLEKEGLLKFDHERAAKQSSGEGKSSRPQPRSIPNGEEPGKEDDDNTVLRWVICLIFMPLYIVISIFGIVIWLLMAPFLICSKQDSCYANTTYDIYEKVVLAPVRAYHWAKLKRGSAGLNMRKKRYGGTEDPEKGTKK
ncbi:uncharacterized protein LOC116619776 [Nematostella vectensis]|uniref:uncharacterized protein LOC116619776 n=1 Tax=Nematostella vectensis TaxID=45351 RepID=UPI0013904517|nr:uncharacterized protein LOC116619776 [Nematostella vectensis]